MVDPPTSVHQEKPNHEHILNSFRVNQCLKKCTSTHCIDWHFPLQRRRAPILQLDGSFNYSSFIYCQEFDRVTSFCPVGDSCPYLHKVYGDVERKYHPRYFKTCKCVYGIDNDGNCSEYGQHCAFAHGKEDKRKPVFAQFARAVGSAQVGDVASFQMDQLLQTFKTAPCRKPHHLRHVKVNCPYFHDNVDFRRNPEVYHYRAETCPAVRQGPEWLAPAACSEGITCQLCHTTTEFYYHPKVYKTRKCTFLLEGKKCFRGKFCAFAHSDDELRSPIGPSTSTLVHQMSTLDISANQPESSIFEDNSGSYACCGQDPGSSGHP